MQGGPIYAQLAREATDRLTLEPGTLVYVSHARGEVLPEAPPAPVLGAELQTAEAPLK
jgi:hypothetical protein